MYLHTAPSFKLTTNDTQLEIGYFIKDALEKNLASTYGDAFEDDIDEVLEDMNLSLECSVQDLLDASYDVVSIFNKFNVKKDAETAVKMMWQGYRESVLEAAKTDEESHKINDMYYSAYYNAMTELEYRF